MSDITPEEFELGWDLNHPDGEIIHVDATPDGDIVEIDESPYEDDEDD